MTLRAPKAENDRIVLYRTELPRKKARYQNGKINLGDIIKFTLSNISPNRIKLNLPYRDGNDIRDSRHWAWSVPSVPLCKYEPLNLISVL